MEETMCMERMNTRNNVRERRLQQYVIDKTPVNAIMRNGFQMRGTVIEFDDSVVVVNVNGVEKMLFNSSLSTIEPYVHYAARQHYTDASWASPPREFLRDR